MISDTLEIKVEKKGNNQERLQKYASVAVILVKVRSY